MAALLSSGMDTLFHPMRYNRCYYISVPGLQLIHISFLHGGVNYTGGTTSL